MESTASTWTRIRRDSDEGRAWRSRRAGVAIAERYHDYDSTDIVRAEVACMDLRWALPTSGLGARSGTLVSRDPAHPLDRLL